MTHSPTSHITSVTIIQSFWLVAAHDAARRDIVLYDVTCCAYYVSHEIALMVCCHLTASVGLLGLNRNGGRSHEEDDAQATLWWAREGAQDKGEDRAGSVAHGRGARTSGAAMREFAT